MPKSLDTYVLGHNYKLVFESDADTGAESIHENDHDTTARYDIEDGKTKEKALELLYHFSTKHLEEALQAENLLVLAGAGASACDGGPLMWDLWKQMLKSLTPAENELIASKVQYDISKPDIEALLSRIELYLELNADSEVSELRIKLVALVVTGCSFVADAKHHQVFLRALLSASSRSTTSRPKVFTTNYDFEFERAAQATGTILVDGFSFAATPIFDGKYFDYDFVIRKGSRVPEADNFAPNVLHLYKLHGSLGWRRTDDGSIAKSLEPIDEDKRVLIYPSKKKFESSYSQPYFELMSRFQIELRKKVPTTLFIIGYGFGDEHINSMIKEAVRHQQNFRIVVVNGNIDKDVNVEMSSFMKNEGVRLGTVTFLNLYFAEKNSSGKKTLVDLIPTMRAFTREMPNA